jgi:hypothetical protein
MRTPQRATFATPTATDKEYPVDLEHLTIYAQLGLGIGLGLGIVGLAVYRTASNLRRRRPRRRRAQTKG